MLLSLPASLRAETAARQQALRQSFAPAGASSGQADGEVVEGASYVYDPVSPLVVDFAAVDPKAQHTDSMYERWLRGELDLDERESILSAAEIAELQAIAIRAGVTAGVQFAESGPGLKAPLPAGVSFDSINYNGSGGFVPPDPEMAVGPNHIIVVVNVAVAIYDKSGNTLLGPVPASSLFSGASCVSGLYDPNVLYDEEADRWILAYDKGAFSPTGGYCLLASQTGDPLGSWNEYFFPLNNVSGWLDYPHAGVGDNFIFMGGNIFNFGGFFVEGRIYAFNKANLYSGSPVTAIAQGLTSALDTPQPINLHGASTGTWPNWGDTHLFMAEPYDGVNYTLLEWDTVTLTNRGNLAIGTGLFPVDVTQSGGSNIQANDWRPLDFEYRNGYGWMTATNGCNPGGGTVNCLLWAQINLATATLGPAGSGIYASSGEHRFFPDLAVNACDDMALGYSKSSPSMFPAVWVTGRESGDPAGQLQAEIELKAGEIAYTAFDSPPHRWGDYSGMTIDPDGVTFWYFGEYSKITGNPNGRWGNYIGSFTYPGCSVAMNPSITLTKTVGTEPAVCAATDEISVTIGTEVTYCYTVENDGDVTLHFHDLVDSELGTILNDFPLALVPGASTFVTETTTVMATTTNTATWTAFNLPYTYDDHVPYNFIDISATGTPLNLTDDGEANVTMPFQFTYFGTTSNLVRIGNNGGILFATTTGDVGFTNTALPNAAHPLTIFPFWDDLDDETGNVYYETVGTAPHRMFIVQWHERPHFPGPGVGNVTFQAILYESTNEMLFQYADVDFGDPMFNYGASATVGLNQDGVTAVQYSFNQPVLSDGMAILWTPTVPASASASASATVNVLIPEIAVSPLTITVNQPESAIVDYTLTISNTGAGDLNWIIDEAPPVAPVTSAPRDATSSGSSTAKAAIVTDIAQCALYENYVGAEPAGYAEHCLGITISAGTQTGVSPFAPTDTGYAQDIGFVSDNFVSFTLNDFPGQSVIGLNNMALFGMDFDPTATILYALDNTGQQLGTMDLSSGAFTVIGPSVPLGGHTWTGLTIDPVTGVLYASSVDGATAALYTLNPATGAATLINTQTTTPLLIDIAMNMSGEMYGHDISTDSIYTIDPATAAATLVGPTGYNANFAQGMDFDNDDGTLYIFLYIGGGANVYGTVDLATGAVTPLATDNPLGEFEGATQTLGIVPACSLPADVPWLSVSPSAGTTPAGGSSDVAVTIDATGLTLGDTYTATLCVNSNDPVNPLVEVPVEVTIIPAVYGVELSADMTDSGEVGTAVVYTLSITNTGNIADTFDLSATGVWPATLSDAAITLSPGASTTFTVSVAIPAGADDGDIDVTTVTATSQSDASATDSATLTTTAVVPVRYIYLPLIKKP